MNRIVSNSRIGLVVIIITFIIIVFINEQFGQKTYLHYLVASALVENLGWNDNKYYYAYGYDKYFRISTTENDEEKDDTASICSKLLETCEVPTTNGTEDKGSKDSGNDISKKYFEQGNAEITASPKTSTAGAGQILNKNNVTEAIDKGSQIYGISTLGVSVLRPTGWEIVSGNNTAYLENILISPLENNADKYREKALIRVSDVSDNVTLESYIKEIAKNLKNQTDFKISEFSLTTLSDNPAYKLIGVRSGNQILNELDLWTIKNSKLYEISFLLEDGKSKMYLPIVQKMVDSFRINR